MLVTFKTAVHANILMFGSDALTMLKIMGQSGTIPGAILAEDVPAALAALVAAMDAQKNIPPVQVKDEEEAGVSLRGRGLPLIELFSWAARAGKNVMWE